MINFGGAKSPTLQKLPSSASHLSFPYSSSFNTNINSTVIGGEADNDVANGDDEVGEDCRFAR